MSVRSLHNSIRDELQLSVRVVSKHGNLINVDETFELRCTITNTADPVRQTDDPNIVFTDPDIIVRGGEHAEPVDGDGGLHDLDDERLHPGESDSIDVKFRATDDLPFWEDITNKEDVANIWAEAELDYEKLFSNFQVKDEFKHEIKKT
jgi:hypothetical protein